MKKNAFLNAIEKTNFIFDEDTFLLLDSGISHSYINYLGNELSISENFLLELVKNDDCFTYFNRIIEENRGILKFSYLLRNQLAQTVNISVSDAIRLLEVVPGLKEYEDRINEVKQKCNVVSLLDKAEDEYYTRAIQNKDIVLNVKDMLNVLLLDEPDFIKILNNLNILGIEKKEFAYTLTKYIEDKRIFDKYLFDSKFIDRYHDLKNQKYIDFQSVDFGQEERIIKYDAQLNPNLRKEIYSDMNPDYNKLEKSIYVYIKLCKLFSYDPIYYASGQRGEEVEYHKDLERIQSIYDKDDDIVCYEFNVIYGKFLEDLNIPYRINTKRQSGEYGKGHANLVYNIDNHIVFADAVTSIVGGDLINAKLNLPLEGLKSQNLSDVSKEEFDKTLDKVYQDIIAQESTKDNNKSKVLEYLDIYNKVSDSSATMPIDKKVKLAIDLTNNSKMKIVDSIGYLMKIKRLIFTSDELKNNIKFIIIRSNIKDKKRLGIIVAKKENEEYKYWYYIPTKKMLPINKMILKQLIKKGFIESIEGSDRSIPGIGEVGRK